jgi:hypothetical protein
MHGRAASLLLVVGAVCLGCGRGSNSEPVKIESSHARLLTMLYNRMSSRLGHSPRDEKEFKNAIASANIPPQNMKVDSIDQVFISERDGKPLVVAYAGPAPGSDVIIYEQEGVNGKRMIGHSIGMVEEVDEARFRELVPAKPATGAAGK